MAGRRKKGMGSLSKRADGMWIASIELPTGPDGKRRRKTAARKDRGQAQAELRKMRAELDAHGDMQTTRLRLGEWMETYLAQVAPRRDRPNNLRSKVSNNRNWIEPALGRRYLDRLTPDDVRHLHDRIREAGRSESTVASVHSTLSAALTAAMREGKVRVNVCTLVDTPKAGRAEDNSLSPDAARQLIAHVLTRSDAALWLTFLLTGARRGEVLGLESDRVFPTHLDVRWQLQAPTKGAKYPPRTDVRPLDPPFFLVDPKTATSKRLVPLLPELAEALARHMDGRPPGLVFTREDGTPFRPDYITKAWRQLLRDAGVNEDVSLHGARHTVVDMLYEAGAEERLISQVLGHSSRAMTRSYQQRIDLDAGRRALSPLSSLLHN